MLPDPRDRCWHQLRLPARARALRRGASSIPGATGYEEPDI
jgi:hypothetical protein